METPKAHIIQAALDGRIVKLNADKGFGFIRPKVRGADIYFKLSEQVAGLCLCLGTEVLFNLKDTEGYVSACDLTVLGQNPRSQQLNGLLTQLDDLISRNKVGAVDRTATKDPCDRTKDPCRRVPFQERKHGPIAQVPRNKVVAVDRTATKDPCRRVLPQERKHGPIAQVPAASGLRRKFEESTREDDEQSQVSTAADSVAESWVGAESWVLAQLG